MTSIIIVTHNHLAHTQMCIESIRCYASAGTYEIIVVDNHSSDETAAWLQRQPDLKAVLNDENYGYPKGCNQGIAASAGAEVLLMNNDIVVTRNWLEDLKTALYSGDEIGAVGPAANYCSAIAGNQTVGIQYKSIDEMHLVAGKWRREQGKNAWEEQLYLSGFCLLIKRAAIDKVGVLDEQFGLGSFEDFDYSLRMLQGNYRLLLCRGVFVHHYGKVTFDWGVQQNIDLLHANMAKMQAKWGFNVFYSMGCRNDFIRLMEMQRPNLCVLEVGCSCGGTLLKIKEQNAAAEVYGVEIDPGPAAIASHFAAVVSQDIETEEFPFPKKRFDYILFGDVLEHLRNPLAVLRQVTRFLKDDGFILASIPNVMHISVVRGLLQGSWTYQDAGILDRTHLRFFTAHEIEKMFSDAGLTVENCGSSQVALSAEDEFYLKGIRQIEGAADSSQFTAYQYFVRGKKVKTDSLAKLLKTVDADCDLQENADRMVASFGDVEGALIPAIEEESEDKAKAAIALAAAFCRRGLTQQALVLLIEMYARHQDDADLICALCTMLWRQGNAVEALHLLAEFQKADARTAALKNKIESDLPRTV